MPTEELGASAYRKYDMEAWMPGRGSWGEVWLQYDHDPHCALNGFFPDFFNVKLHRISVSPTAHSL